MTFAEGLREWRQRRRVSQIELALRAGTTQRHLSFIESGRSTPGRAMVIRLAESLEVPLRERNTLLLSAGYAPAYQESRWDDGELTPVRTALERVLRGHQPYPAILVDRHGDLVAAHNPNPQLTALIDELVDLMPNRPRHPGPDHLGFAVPLRLRTTDGELHLLTTLSHFGTAVDITVAELRLEAFLPADEKTAALLTRGGQAAG